MITWCTKFTEIALGQLSSFNARIEIKVSLLLSPGSGTDKTII